MNGNWRDKKPMTKKYKPSSRLNQSHKPKEQKREVPPPPLQKKIPDLQDQFTMKCKTHNESFFGEMCDKCKSKSFDMMLGKKITSVEYIGGLHGVKITMDDSSCFSILDGSCKIFKENIDWADF